MEHKALSKGMEICDLVAQLAILADRIGSVELLTCSCRRDVRSGCLAGAVGVLEAALALQLLGSWQLLLTNLKLADLTSQVLHARVWRTH